MFSGSRFRELLLQTEEFTVKAQKYNLLPLPAQALHPSCFVLIAVINSLRNGREHVEFCRAVQDIQSVADACMEWINTRPGIRKGIRLPT